MKSNDKKVFNDVLNVIYNLPKNIIDAIPNDVIKMLEENQDPDYISNIDFSDENWSDKLDQTTSELLALLYRDYIVSEDQRNKLLQVERQIYIKNEENLKIKYDVNNLFEHKRNFNLENIENLPMKIEEKKWYNKWIGLLKKILKK